MLELVGILGAPGAAVGFALAYWKGPRGAIASFGVGAVLIIGWMLSPAILGREPLTFPIAAVAAAFSIQWWLGAFPGAALGIAARNFRQRKKLPPAN
jgi:hypothetical protein